PQAIVDKLNEAVSKVVSDPGVKREWAKQGATPMVMTPAQFQKYLEGDIAKWAKVIKTANIKAD
ncbi:MAG TPA: tripartite tricarboxylate transporter substrate-binding protein, partial [Ramlibacter sp.]